MPPFDFGTINTAETDGVELAAILENWRDSVHSSHANDSVPGYAVQGLVWLDIAPEKPLLKLYGDSGSGIIGEMNLTGNVFTPYIGGNPAGALATKDSVGEADLEDGIITSDKMAAGAILSEALSTDIIRAVHIDPDDIEAIREELDLGSAALLEASIFGDLAGMDTVGQEQIEANSVGLDELEHQTGNTLVGMNAAGVPSIISAGENVTIDDGIISASGGLESVSQGDLNTSIGSVSHNYGSNGEPDLRVSLLGGLGSGSFGSYLYVEAASSTHLTLPGGQYGLFPQCRRQIITAFNHTFYAQQRYVDASPPFDLGDGDVAGFLYLRLDQNGDVKGHYFAEVPPWGYNGPTNITACAKCPKTGKKFRKVAKPRTLEQVLDGVPVEYEMQEITHAVKNADMPLIPAPFSAGPDETVVLVNPRDDRIAYLFEHQNGLVEEHNQAAAEEIAEAIASGRITTEDEPMNVKGPPGIKVTPFKFA